LFPEYCVDYNKQKLSFIANCRDVLRIKITKSCTVVTANACNFLTYCVLDFIFLILTLNDLEQTIKVSSLMDSFINAVYASDLYLSLWYML